MRKNPNCAIIGRSGTGKSHLLKGQLLARITTPVVLIDSQNEYAHLPVVCDNVIDLIDLIELKERMIRFVSDKEADFERIVRIVYECYINMYIVCEEVSIYLDPLSAPVIVKSYLKFGRHSDLGFICTTQRPAECHRIITSQSDYLFIFKLHEPRDIEYLKRIPNIENMISELDEHEFFVYNTNTGQTLKNIIPAL